MITHRRVRLCCALVVILTGARDASAALISYQTDLQVGGMSVPSASSTITPPNLGSATLTVTPISSVASIDIGFVPTTIPFGRQTVDTSMFAVIVPAQSRTIGFAVLIDFFLTLTDDTTLASGTLQFTAASIGGSVSTANPGGITPRIQTGYFPFLGLGGQTRTVQVGDTAYDVTLISSGLSLDSNQLIDSSTFQVDVVQSVPEPASLMLLGLGLVVSTWKARRR